MGRTPQKKGFNIDWASSLHQALWEVINIFGLLNHYNHPVGWMLSVILWLGGNRDSGISEKFRKLLTDVQWAMRSETDQYLKGDLKVYLALLLILFCLLEEISGSTLRGRELWVSNIFHTHRNISKKIIKSNFLALYQE